MLAPISKNKEFSSKESIHLIVDFSLYKIDLDLSPDVLPISEKIIFTFTNLNCDSSIIQKIKKSIIFFFYVVTYKSFFDFTKYIIHIFLINCYQINLLKFHLISINLLLYQTCQNILYCEK